MNLFDILKSAFGPYMDGEKPPLSIAEAFNLWYYLSGTKLTLRVDQVAYNIVEDNDLKVKLSDIIQNVHTPMVRELKEFLRKEGVPLPNLTPDKVLVGDFQQIPSGAKLNDEEVANLLAYNLYIGINLASRGLTESTRSDVGAMFAKYFMMKVTFSLTLKDMMRNKGWLKVPPTFKP